MADDAAQDDGFVALASFENRHSAERSVASLGKHFRAMSRKGHADALVAKANADGSLEVRQSRALKTGNLANLAIRLSSSIAIGFLGIFSALKGVKQSGHALHVHQHHVGQDEQQVHAILASAGSRSALLLVRCDDNSMLETVVSATSKGAVYSWQGSLSEFLDSLDPGSDDDWVRAAVGKASH